MRSKFEGVNSVFARMSNLGCALITVGSLVGSFMFNGPLRQYFSLYRAVSQRGRKKREVIEEGKLSNNSHPHLLQAQ